MQVTVQGWSRNHGPKELLRAELAYSDVREKEDRYTWGSTYIDLVREVRPPHPARPGQPRLHHTVRVTGSRDVNLSGSYMVQLELDQTEIARLFCLTHGAESAVEALEEAVRSLRALRNLRPVGQ
jgi:hypothetical protein